MYMYMYVRVMICPSQVEKGKHVATVDDVEKMKVCTQLLLTHSRPMYQHNQTA